MKSFLNSKPFKIFLFTILLGISLAFLFSQKGIWWFVDGMYMPQDSFSNNLMIEGGISLFSTSQYSTYFGVSQELFSSQKILKDIFLYSLNTLFGFNLGQVAFFTIFLLCNFLFSKLFFDLLDKKENNYYIALFFTFNPWSLWLLNKSGVAFSYTAFFMFLYGFLLLYKTKSKASYFIIAISSYLLFLYVRTAIMNVILIAMILGYVFFISGEKKRIIEFIAENKIKFLLSLIVIVLVNLPKLILLTNLISGNAPWLSHLDDDAGLSWLNEDLYDFKHLFLFNNINSIFDFMTNHLHTFLSIALFILVFGGIFFTSNKSKKEEIYFVSLYLAAMFTQVAVILIDNTNLLVSLYNSFFIFSSRNIPYGTFMMVQLFPILLFLVYRKNPRLEQLLGILLIAILAVSVIPFLNFDNFELEKVSFDTLSNFEDTSNERFPIQEASILVPSFDYILFKGYPYPVNPRFLMHLNRELLSSNKRISLPDEVKVRESLGEYSKSMKIFNVKNFYIFKGKNPEVKYDFFTTPGYFNYESFASQKTEEFLARKELSVVKENSDYLKFRFNDADDYDFLIYSPQKVLEFDTFKSDRDINEGSFVFLDKKEFEKFDTGSEQNPIKLELKIDSTDASRYYVRAINVSKDYVIQLNRRYSEDWKIFRISEKEYEKVECDTESKEYRLSNNNLCLSDFSYFDSHLLRYFSEGQEYLHAPGNLIGNAWEVDDTKGEDYFVIVYKPQMYYSVLNLVSWITLIALAFLMMQKVILNIKIRYVL